MSPLQNDKICGIMKFEYKRDKIPLITWRYIQYIYRWAERLQCTTSKQWYHGNLADLSIGEALNSPNHKRVRHGRLSF